VATFNVKGTEDMNEQETAVAYALYFVIATLSTILLILFNLDVPRGIFIALWGLPIGVVVVSIVSKEWVRKRNYILEFGIGAIGFIAYMVYSIVLGEFTILTIWDVYYYAVGITIVQLALVFFYILYLATDNLEQRNFHLMATPAASFVILIATYVATYLTRVYI
jgi:hypothetical protein